MARLSRLVIPGYPHHVTQRGVRSIDIFSSDEDRYAYLNFMAEESERFGLSFLAWCLMNNHVHLIVVPEKESSLARAIGEAHRRYSRMKNFNEGVRGYLFQGRFGSCVLDEPHLLAAARYVELNPVKAGLAEYAWDYPWSSCRFHSRQTETDLLVHEATLPEMVDDWKSFLHQEDLEAQDRVLKGTRTGRPVGSTDFVSKLEAMSSRILHPGMPGRPRKDK